MTVKLESGIVSAITGLSPLFNCHQHWLSGYAWAPAILGNAIIISSIMAIITFTSIYHKAIFKQSLFCPISDEIGSCPNI